MSKPPELTSEVFTNIIFFTVQHLQYVPVLTSFKKIRTNSIFSSQLTY